MKDLKQREGHPEGYYYAEINGRKYSVVDFGKTMATHPMPEGLFMGWEAMELSSNGHLKPDEMYRGETWEELWNTISTKE